MEIRRALFIALLNDSQLSDFRPESKSHRLHGEDEQCLSCQFCFGFGSQGHSQGLALVQAPINTGSSPGDRT